MPNRLIHEKAIKSETLAKLSAEAERLFWRLTAIADDKGRFDAYPQTVKAECFPRMVDQIKTKEVIAWLSELAQECIRLYVVDGRQYGYFVKWSEYQRIYGNKPKFPQPPADCGSSPQNSALIPTPTPTPTSTSISTGPPSGGRERGKVVFPPEWKPSQEEMEQWKGHGIPNPHIEFACFRDHALTTDRRCKDWHAAWRNWCRKALRMAQGGTRWPA